jgi:hypothetical protein
VRTAIAAALPEEMRPLGYDMQPDARPNT